MSDDLVTRLRHVAWLAEEGSEVTDLAATAADEIERLRTENALLASFLYPVGMMMRPTGLPADGIDETTAEEVQEFLEDRRG